MLGFIKISLKAEQFAPQNKASKERLALAVREAIARRGRWPRRPYLACEKGKPHLSPPWTGSHFFCFG
jgi:hypothetical protein